MGWTGNCSDNIGKLREASTSPLVLPPTGRLLIACLRSTLAAGQSPEVAEAAIDFQDWPTFLDSAGTHGLLPIIAGCFDANGIRAPDKVKATLDAALFENARRVLVMSEEVNRVIRLFDAAGIPALAVKGPVSAWTLYEDPAYRVFSDLDLLVPPHSVPDARRILSGCGYEPMGPARFGVAREAFLPRLTEMVYQNSRSGIHIDLHWELTPRDWYASLPPDLWARTRTVAINGCAVRTLSEEDTFLHLCFHGAKHGWSNLNWLLDVCGLLMRSPGVAGRSLRLVDPESKAAAMVQFGVAAAALTTPDIPHLTEAMTNVPERIEVRARALVYSAVSGETGDDTTLGRCRFQWNLGGSQLAMSRYVVQWLFQPDQTDWSTLPIQHRRLLFLLVPWRLMRLVRRAVSGAL